VYVFFHVNRTNLRTLLSHRENNSIICHLLHMSHYFSCSWLEQQIQDWLCIHVTKAYVCNSDYGDVFGWTTCSTDSHKQIYHTPFTNIILYYCKLKDVSQWTDVWKLTINDLNSNNGFRTWWALVLLSLICLSHKYHLNKLYDECYQQLTLDTVDTTYTSPYIFDILNHTKDTKPDPIATHFPISTLLTKLLRTTSNVE
jgi:hypothetical protein